MPTVSKRSSHIATSSNVTVTVDDVSFNAYSVHAGIETMHDNLGMPMMGSLQTTFSASIDINDNINMPFATFKKLFDLANIVNRSKLVPIKLEFWRDDNKTDAVCTFAFTGWLAAFHVDGGGGVNHILQLRLVPKLDPNNFTDIKVGN